MDSIAEMEMRQDVKRQWEYHLDAWEVHILKTQLCVTVYCSVLQCVVVCCSTWQCVAVCCRVLQCLVMLHNK